MCLLGFLIWMRPPFSFATITHCTFINLASVSTGQRRRLSGDREPARDHQEVLRHIHACAWFHLFGTVSAIWWGAVYGPACMRKEWWKSQERPGALNAALLVGFTFSQRNVSWMLMENSHCVGITWLHYREDATKPPQVHHGGGLPQRQNQDSGFNLRSEEPLMT